MAANRILAPLRRIRTRELFIFSYHPNGDMYLFTVWDTLECGHQMEAGYMTFDDLIDPHTESPAIRARRHRCHECLALAAAKKPAASVVLAKAVAA